LKPSFLVLAEEQERGEGRRGRTWVSPRGGLYASLVVSPRPLLAVRAGVAVATTLRDCGIAAVLKWPNDVLVRDRKIAGVLIEVLDDAAIVGIGVNLAPVLVPGATSLFEEVGHVVERDDLLEGILRRLLAEDEEGLPERYTELCATIGRRVRLEFGGGGSHRALVGRALGIDGSGRLVVESGGRVEAVSTGDCLHLEEEPHPSRPASGQDEGRRLD